MALNRSDRTPLSAAQRSARPSHGDPCRRRSFLHNVHLPTVPVRLDRNRHIGGPVADVLHFYLDRGFEFSGCLARLFHSALVNRGLYDAPNPPSDAPPWPPMLAARKLVNDAAFH